MTNRKKLWLLLGLLFFIAASAVLAIRHKYYVKKLLKSNPVTYTLAKSAVKLKYQLSRLVSSAETKPARRLPDLTKDSWTITVDASQSIGKLNKFWAGLGYESWKNGVLSSRNRQLFELIKASNKRAPGSFRFVRAHNLFSDGKPPFGEGLKIYQEDAAGRPVYNWVLLDRVFDRIVEAGLIPIVEFGFMPDALASIPDRRQKWGKGNISPPKDYKKWGALVKATVEHLVERYGRDRVLSWYFEVWNEPDLGYLFWIEDEQNPHMGDMEAYFQLYDHTVRAAKSALPGIRIGGPASAGGGIDLLLEHLVLKRKRPQDIGFVSTHIYGKVGYSPEEDKSILHGLSWKLSRAYAHDHPRVQETMARLPVLLTEIGPWTRANRLHNSNYLAAWLVKMVDGLLYLGQVREGWKVPEVTIFWSSFQVDKYFKEKSGVATAIPVQGGGELIVKRPVFNAFEALGYLGSERLQTGGEAQFGEKVHLLATKNQKNEIQILLYHLNEWDGEALNQDTSRIQLHVENVPFQRYDLEMFRIDAEHSNGYMQWIQMGSPRSLTRSQARSLDSRDDLQRVEHKKGVPLPGSRLELNLDLVSGGLILILIKKAG